MKRILLIAALALTGCQQAQQQGAIKANICDPLPLDGWWEDKALTQQQKTEYCLQTWAYRLAPSPDNSETVADAVMFACRGMVAVETIQAVKDSHVLDSQNGDYAEGVRKMEENLMRKTAVFRVVQAKAGKCPVPQSAISQG